MGFINTNYIHRSSKYYCKNICLYEANANNGIPHIKECTTRNTNRNTTKSKYKCEFENYSPTDLVNQQQPQSNVMRQSAVIRRYFRFS
jgi:hypothetical protein